MKLLKFVCFLFIIAGCTKDVDDSLFTGVSRPVINCYFNPDSSWKVELWNSAPLVNKSDFLPITDAKVEIETENRASFQLAYMHDGIYSSPSKPLPNTEYTIRVASPQYGDVLATNSVPGEFPATAFYFSEIQELFTPKNDVMSTYDVNRISLTLGVNNNSYYYLRAYIYEPLYTNISLTDSSLNNLKNTELPEFLLDSLYKIKDIIYDNIDVFKSAIIDVWHRSRYETAYGHLVVIFAEKDTIPFKRANLEKVSLFTNDPYFSNHSDDAYLVLGKIEGPMDNRYNLDLFVFNDLDNGTGATIINGVEVWEKRLVELYIDFRIINQAMYEYLRTYNLQVVNRTNPFSESVSVYSNIENGIGIFAGYQGKLIRVY